MIFFRNPKFTISNLEQQNMELKAKNAELQKEKETMHKELLEFIDLYNYYHQYFIHKEHVYYPKPMDIDAYASGCGKAMNCVRCGAIVGSDDGFCRKCGVRLKYV